VHRLFCSAALGVAAATAISAQVAPVRPEPFPAVAIAAPAAAEPTPPPGAAETVRLQFPNSDVVDVLHLYEQISGKKLVMDIFVHG
jgi:hypothetical protein